MTRTDLKLENGDSMPVVGLGMWKSENKIVPEIVVQAAELGYRLFDCASDYGNEKEVGEGIRRVLDDGICSREELWVTSKLWNTYHARQHVRPAVERSLGDLGLECLDLYLVHFPIALEFVPFEKRYPPGWVFDPAASAPCLHPVDISFRETWEAMEQLVADGLVRNIGLSNVGCAMIRDVLSYAKVRPSVLQIELHPYLTQEKLLRFCCEEKIAVTGFSTLGSLSYVSIGMASENDSVLEETCVKRAAQRLEKTPAQIVLRWAVQHGTAIVPKSTNPGRLAENLALFDFELNNEEMETISQLNTGRRFNDPGEFCEEAFGTFFPIYE